MPSAVIPGDVVAKQRPKTRGDPSGPVVYLRGTRPNHIRVGSHNLNIDSNSSF